MRLKTPSPAMAVALTALGISLSGTAVAAVSYATNAGKVDGRDAVSSKSSTSKAAGNLVATDAKGEDKGKIPGKFLGDVMRGEADSFSRVADVQDNATDVPTVVTTIPGLGHLTATCGDQNPTPGVEDPTTNLSFANTAGSTVNFVRRVGDGKPVIAVVPNNTTADVTITGSNTFSIWLQRGGTHYLLDGVVRQDGRGQPGAQCVVYGYSSIIQDVR